MKQMEFRFRNFSVFQSEDGHVTSTAHSSDVESVKTFSKDSPRDSGPFATLTFTDGNKNTHRVFMSIETLQDLDVRIRDALFDLYLEMESVEIEGE